MPLSALGLVLAAALLHAWWNLLLKRAGAGGMALVWGICAATSIVFALPVVLGIGAGLDGIDTGQAIAIAASAALHTLYFWLLQRGYGVGDLSVVYPVARGIGPLLTVFIAIAWLGERAAAATIVGALLVVAGTFTVAGGASIWRRGLGPRTASGIVWGALVGIVIAAYTVNDGRAVRLLGADPLVFYWLVNVVQTLALVPFVAGRQAVLRHAIAHSWRTMLAVGVLSPLAYMLVLQAMTIAPVSVVAPARELSMLVAAFLGAHLLGEGELRRRVLGAALIAGGVACLTFVGGGR